MITNRKSCPHCRLLRKSSTLDDFERSFRTVLYKACVIRSLPWAFDRRQTHTVDQGRYFERCEVNADKSSGFRGASSPHYEAHNKTTAFCIILHLPSVRGCSSQPSPPNAATSIHTSLGRLPHHSWKRRPGPPTKQLPGGNPSGFRHFHSWSVTRSHGGICRGTCPGHWNSGSPQWNLVLCPRLGWLTSPSLVLVNCPAGTTRFSLVYKRL